MSSSNFPAEFKKSLVRVTKDVVPKTRVINQHKGSATEMTKTSSNVKKTTKSNPKIDLSMPSVNSCTTIAGKIKQVENVKQRRIKSLADIATVEKLAVNEKITKQMNFPYDQKIFKGLIPLCSKSSSQPVLISREPLPQKDIEPNLSDFLTHKVQPEYSFKVPIKSKSQKVMHEYDGFKIYRLMQQW